MRKNVIFPYPPKDINCDTKVYKYCVNSTNGNLKSASARLMYKIYFPINMKIILVSLWHLQEIPPHLLRDIFTFYARLKIKTSIKHIYIIVK